jgi:hypothetical protein
MSSLFDKLNLKPGERRLVIFVGIAVFVLLNAFFVWPRFSDWGKLQKRKREAAALLKAFQDEIANTSRYQKQLAELQQAGAAVASAEQASKMQSTVQNQAALSGVQVNTYSSERPGTASSGKLNQFFEEQRGRITVTTEEKALVDFLYNLGVGGSMIRVRSMNLNTDPPRHKLVGNMELVASYAKQAPSRATPGASTPAARPATPAPAASTRSTGSTNNAARSGFAAARATNTAPAGGTNRATKK